MALGRPLKFKSVDDLKKLADEYFATTPEGEWTITGLALALDTTRDTLIDYQKKDDFSDTIKRYKEMVHRAYEKDLRKKGRAGDIFALKNFGWTDQRQLDHRSMGKPISILANVHGNDSDQEAPGTEEEG